MIQRGQRESFSNGTVCCSENINNDCSRSDDAIHHEKTNGTSSVIIKQELLRISEMPTYLQFNRYVLNGYRPLAPASGCILSLFSLHNETLNILTHAIPLAYIIFHASELLPYDEIGVRFLPYFHILATISPWLGSFIYHLFMNHKSGEVLYKRLLQVDMIGIWFTQSFGALITIYASIFCLGKPAHHIIFSFYFVLSVVALYKAVVAGSPWQRRCSFALQVVLRSGLLVLRLSPYGGGDPQSLSHVILQDLLAIIGGAIGATRIPEKWFPGKFDYFGNSHHIMHILVVTAVVHMHRAAKLDLLWISQGSAQCALPK